MADTEQRRGVGGWASTLYSLFVALIGLTLAVGGAHLARLGGSFYYLIAGVGLVVAGGLMAWRRASGGVLYGLIAILTVIWALWEAGLAFWPLFARVFSPVVIGLGVLLALLALARDPRRGRAMAMTGLGVAAGLATLGTALVFQFTDGQAKHAAPLGTPMLADRAASDWRFYGRDPGGLRFAPYDQINTANVGKLKAAWRIHTGDVASLGSEDQDTPSQIGDTVYICTPRNIVVAVDADTGVQRWRYDPKVEAGSWNRCRGVGYYESPAKAPAGPVAAAPEALCGRRIVETTIDARLIELDAATGAPCPSFGQAGVVSLADGMGLIRKGLYSLTSAPTVADGLVIVGGWVVHNDDAGESSGVVRAFSAETGELVWAWDLGDPTITKLPPPGKTYSLGTPNVWSTLAFDPALGLVYLPTGNGASDYWGARRSEATERYSSSVVALDIKTGQERWRYQTVHHDLWDYDVPSQPMLVDFPDGRGGTTPALIQLTKRGQTFVLDRRTGVPLIDVVERPVPQTTSKGDWTSPTQPYPVGMPAIGAARLTEAKMWGATPLDQLWCRIAFRSRRYLGDFTPPGTTPSIQYPGGGGGQNWGSGTYDATHGYLIVTGMRMPSLVTLTPGNKPTLLNGPYESNADTFLSPAAIPCLEPPVATMTAVDLKTRKIVWQAPTGSAEASGPLGWASHLPISLGTPGVGGAISTAGGLAFHAATTDPYLRAYDTATGKVLWKAALPVGVGGTPMTYVSPKTGKQYVLVTAGGARDMPQRGDYAIAYALP
jgi:quinate dehydrogenase (quinone)